MTKGDNYQIEKDDLFAEAVVQLQQAKNFVLIFTKDNDTTDVLSSMTVEMTVKVIELAALLLSKERFEDMTGTIQGVTRISGQGKDG